MAQRSTRADSSDGIVGNGAEELDRRSAAVETDRETHTHLVVVRARVALTDALLGEDAHRLTQSHRRLEPSVRRESAEKLVVALVCSGRGVTHGAQCTALTPRSQI